MTDFIELILPAPESLGNARGHSRWEASKKSKYIESIGWLLNDYKRKNPGIFPMKAATWTAYLEVGNYYDWDNLAAILKWPFDALRDYKLIESDGWFRF